MGFFDSLGFTYITINYLCLDHSIWISTWTLDSRTLPWNDVNSHIKYNFSTLKYLGNRLTKIIRWEHTLCWVRPTVMNISQYGMLFTKRNDPTEQLFVDTNIAGNTLTESQKNWIINVSISHWWNILGFPLKLTVPNNFIEQCSLFRLWLIVPLGLQ